ncbi:MAG: Rnf-Nqr domain containing protein [Oscillospiraceae bacterium]
MNDFLDITMNFFKDMLTYSMIAIFLENTIFSRALGTSTSLFVVRKNFSVFLFGLVMTLIITVSSLVAYIINPLVQNMENKYYVAPAIYVAVIGMVYILFLLGTSKFIKKRKEEILSMIHVSAFNCAVLGALLLSTNKSEMTLGGFLGFGIGTGIGFTVATYFVGLAYEKLSGDEVPYAFRGFPITLIYIGIVSLAVYGLIGHELPF